MAYANAARDAAIIDALKGSAMTIRALASRLSGNPDARLGVVPTAMLRQILLRLEKRGVVKRHPSGIPGRPDIWEVS